MTGRSKKQQAEGVEETIQVPATTERVEPPQLGANLAAQEGFATLDETARAILHRRASSLAQETIDAVAEDLTPILMFALGDEWYAVRVDEVREIHNEYLITPVPCTPDWMRGVLNIRGEIVSVTDIKRLLRLSGELEEADFPVIIVGNGECTTALLVDAIGDIEEVSLDHEELAPPLATIEKSIAELLTGSAHIAGRSVAILNLAKVLEPIGGSS